MTGSQNAETGEERLTDLLRQWLSRGELTAELGGRLWQALRGVVIAELRRRGLWNSSPRYLGIVGNQWLEPGDQQGGPIAELLSEVFFEAIAQPLPRWQALMADPAAHLEAALVKSIRNAIHQIHKRSDRLGYALYQRAREAIDDAVAAGELFVLGDEGKIGNSSLLAASPQARGEPAPPAALAQRIPGWLDELLPELVTGVKEKRRQAVARLRGRLAHLNDEGIAIWRFKDLMDPLKAEVRARWQQRGRDDDGDLLQELDEQGLLVLVRKVQPKTSLKLELEHLEKLLECIADRIEGHPAQQRTLDHFWSLFTYLGTHADPASDNDRLPSARELERLLQIPRDKIPALLAVLGQFLELCQKLLARLVLRPQFARGGST